MMENSITPGRCRLPESANDSSPGLSDSGVERRRHRRYRFREPILIRTTRGVFPGVTQDISISGFSASTTSSMRVAEEVRIATIVGEQVEAIVRHKAENIYGFEFLNIAPKVEEAIHALCKGLFPFRGVEDR